MLKYDNIQSQEKNIFSSQRQIVDDENHTLKKTEDKTHDSIL